MKTLAHSLLFPVSAAVLAIGLTLACPANSRAADHGDAPALAQDQGADIADVFLFMDPNSAGGNSDVVLIATIHGFITPGEAVNFGVFDPNIRYHFEIFNDHVNLDPGPLAPDTGAEKAAKAKYLSHIKANRTIDVTFSPRIAGDDNTGNPTNHDLPEEVRRPSPQTATVTLGGFTGVSNHGKFTQGAPLGTTTLGPLVTTPPTLGANAATQVAYDIQATASSKIQFFAGIVDDPFFFDIPAFSAFIESVRKGAPDITVFNRGRDTFAGYNVMAIALKFPKELLTDSDVVNKPFIGADFMTQRHGTVLSNNFGGKGLGGFKAIDRMGNPGVNVAFVPFNRKNEYNGGTAKLDASLRFVGSLAKPGTVGIVDTLKDLGVGAATDHTDSLSILAGVALSFGDILRLNTSVANTQTGTGGGGDNAQTGFGTAGGGRRLLDDTIDTVLTVVARGLLNNPGATLGDNVGPNQDGFLPKANFPFLHEPHQPIQVTNQVEDGTRN